MPSSIWRNPSRSGCSPWWRGCAPMGQRSRDRRWSLCTHLSTQVCKQLIDAFQICTTCQNLPSNSIFCSELRRLHKYEQIQTQTAMFRATAKLRGLSTNSLYWAQANERATPRLPKKGFESSLRKDSVQFSLLCQLLLVPVLYFVSYSVALNGPCLEKWDW